MRPLYRLWVEVGGDVLEDPVLGPYEFSTRRGLDKWVRNQRAPIVGTKVWHKGEIIELTGTFAKAEQ